VRKFLLFGHDLKNQLSYLCVLIEQNNFDDACKYLNEILNKDEKVFESFSCANMDNKWPK
jgi:hypothetical protein